MYQAKTISSSKKASRAHLLEAVVNTPLRGGLGSTLLQLVPELLGVWILKGFDWHRRFGSGLPLDAALIHHRGLHCDSVCAQNGEIQQELGAEVVIVWFYPLFDLIDFSI